MVKNVAIIGGGRSILEYVDNFDFWNKLKNSGIEVWSLNYSFMSMPFLPSKELFCDKKFWKLNYDKLIKLHTNGVKLVSKKFSIIEHIKEIESYKVTRNEKEFFGKKAKEAGILFSGKQGLTGTFSISYAIASGYENIFLFGFDYGTINYGDKKTHWYQDKISVESSGIGNLDIYLKKNNVPYDGVNNYNIFTNCGVNIYNVNLYSNINCFKKISINEFYNILNGENK